jgi:hypothetical protein
MSLGAIFSLLPWLIAGLVLLALLGFGRPVVEAITRTWTEFVLPILARIAKNPYASAAVIGLAAFGLAVGLWFLADSYGYDRAKGECDTTIAARERDEARETIKRLRDQLARVHGIQLKDATTAMANAELERQNESELNALPANPRLCLDADDARRLWGLPR